MTAGFVWFAAADNLGIVNTIRNWGSSSSGLIEGALIFGVFCLVTLAIFIWAAFFRKPGRRKSRRHHRHHRELPAVENSPAGQSGNLEAAPRSRHHHHRRRRRREHRPRNPTAAETGGLPPVRSGPAEPPQPSV
jgi:hypothetical protein